MSLFPIYEHVYGFRRRLLLFILFGTPVVSSAITLLGINTYASVPSWADKDYIFGIPRALTDYEGLLPHVGEEFSLWFAFHTAALTYVTLFAICISCICLIGVRFDGTVKKKEKLFKIVNPFARDLLILFGIAILSYFILFLGVPFFFYNLRINIPISTYSLFWYVITDFFWIAGMVEAIVVCCRLFFPDRELF